MRGRRARLRLAILAGILLAGCGGGIRHYAVPRLEGPRPFPVAVLPVTDLSATEEAGDVVRFALEDELLRRGDYAPVPAPRVNAVLADLRIRYADRLSGEQVRELGRRLGAAALLVGMLERYEYREVEGEQVPVVSLHLRLIDTAEGRVLWAADGHRVGNDHEFLLGLGVERSLARLGQDVVRAMVATLPSPGGER